MYSVYIAQLTNKITSVSDSDPDPPQETLIWIRVVKKNREKPAYKKTKIIRI